MANPGPVGTAFAVNCYTCLVNIWQGDIAPDDGQTLLTAYADSTPGTVCPSKVDGCPHKTAAVAERPKRKPVVAGDLDDLRKRLDKLEAKVKP
jgi:hypothetical protein